MILACKGATRIEHRALCAHCSRRVYSYRDLLELRVIKSLLDAGIKLESVREVFNYLRSHVDTEITAAHIVISGQSVVLCQGDQLVDVMRNGQGVLNVLPLSGVKDQIDSQIVRMEKAHAPAQRIVAPLDIAL